MPIFGKAPFEDLVEQATNETNISEDWSSILGICDKATNYEEGAKFCLQAINKRLNNNVPHVVVQALTLLDACVKNCGKNFHLEVASRTFVGLIPKLLSKMHPSASDKFKELIKKWAENEFKDDPELGLIPSLYYKLKSEGVPFPEPTVDQKVPSVCTNPDAVNSQEEEEDIIKAIELSLQETKTFANDFQDSNLAINVFEPKKCRALFDFEAAEDNELTIKAGEIILITDQSNENWWKGTNQRGEGYFPMNFVSDDLEADIHTESTTELEKDGEELIKIDSMPAIHEPLKIDENTMKTVLDWITEVDPTEEVLDPNEMLLLECNCYAMAPLIEKELQTIDKKLTLMSVVNTEIMKAVDLFYKLTRESFEKTLLNSNNMFHLMQNSPQNPHGSFISHDANYLPLEIQEVPLSSLQKDPDNNISTTSGQIIRTPEHNSPAMLLEHYTADNTHLANSVASLQFHHYPQQHSPMPLMYSSVQTPFPIQNQYYTAAMLQNRIFPYTSAPISDTFSKTISLQPSQSDSGLQCSSQFSGLPKNVPESNQFSNLKNTSGPICISEQHASNMAELRQRSELLSNSVPNYGEKNTWNENTISSTATILSTSAIQADAGLKYADLSDCQIESLANMNESVLSTSRS